MKVDICYIPGIPSALQFSVRGSFFGTIIEVGCSVMCGDLYWPEIEQREKNS